MKKIFAIALVLSMILAICPLGAFAETYSGTCGDNLTWSFDPETGTLTISGEGEMYFYEYIVAPWFEMSGLIKYIVIENGVTEIGYFAFDSCSRLASIDIPDSVTSIGRGAFYHCESLTSIDIPDAVTSIGDYAFKYCTNLTSIDIPYSVTYIGEGAFDYCESLTTVYYAGSEEEWNAIDVGDWNDSLLNAEIIFNYGKCEHAKGTWNVLEDGTKEKVCVDCGKVIETLGADEFIPNDINGDNNFNMFDYVSVKNCVMKGTDDEALLARCDINGDGKVNMFDYVAIKAAYFAQ